MKSIILKEWKRKGISFLQIIGIKLHQGYVHHNVILIIDHINSCKLQQFTVDDAKSLLHLGYL